jgi:hypothetical protein
MRSARKPNLPEIKKPPSRRTLLGLDWLNLSSALAILYFFMPETHNTRLGTG